MTTKQTCENCRYFEYARSECRKSPPVVVPVQVYDNEIHEWAQIHPVTQWPSVANYDWCGEWKKGEDGNGA
jgi:hypothetical protein